MPNPLDVKQIYCKKCEQKTEHLFHIEGVKNAPLQITLDEDKPEQFWECSKCDNKIKRRWKN